MAIFDSKSAAGKCQANEGHLCVLSKQSYVAVDEAITVQRGNKPAEAKKAPEGQFRSRSRFASRQQNHPRERRGKRTDKERKNRRPETKESRDHRKQFHIAHPHPLPVANGLAKPSNEQQH